MDDDGSYIQHKVTGEIIPIHPKGNLYVIRVKKVPYEIAQRFPRQATKLKAHTAKVSPHSQNH